MVPDTIIGDFVGREGPAFLGSIWGCLPVGNTIFDLIIFGDQITHETSGRHRIMDVSHDSGIGKEKNLHLVRRFSHIFPLNTHKTTPFSWNIFQPRLTAKASASSDPSYQRVAQTVPSPLSWTDRKVGGTYLDLDLNRYMIYICIYVYIYTYTGWWFVGKITHVLNHQPGYVRYMSNYMI